MARVVIALTTAMALAATLAGCTTPVTEAEDDPPTAEQGNPWLAGLADHYDTPPHAATRDTAERRAEVAAPGDPGFIQFDQAMLSIMQRYEVPSASLALMHNGALIYASGYGYTNPDGSGSTDTDTMLRMASVTKPVTHALISLQVEEGLYNLTDPVFCIPPAAASNCRLPLDPHPDHPIIDARIGDITVEMLLDHTAGFDPNIKVDKLDVIQEMQNMYGLNTMPDKWHAATYLMGTELIHEPGSRVVYCTYCYVVAGLIAEAATGATLDALYDAYLFRPLDIESDIELGNMPIEERNPREPFYVSGFAGPSVYDPNETVDYADGNYHLGILSSAGALIGTPEAVATVYEAYPDGTPSPRLLSIEGNNPYEGQYEIHGHTGIQYGTNALSIIAEDIQGNTGIIQYVVLFNADYIRPNAGCGGPEAMFGAGCPGWIEIQNELFILLAEKTRQ